MTVKEYLISEKALNLSEIARRMWPTNGDAKTYLSRKLNDKLSWTDADAKNAKAVLDKMKVDISSLD